MNIRIENKTTYFPVFNPMRREVEAELKARGIEYKVVSKDEIPDDQQQYPVICGHIYRLGISCIVSRANKEDLQLLVDRIHDPRRYGEVDAE
ncbi:MAG: hypothetical protein IKH31_00445 [Clostridia bacterium]|nr:hypothetical protein [Clostridia bacterium]